MDAEETFKAKAPTVMRWLMRDFHLVDFQAAGILGNTGRECLGFTVLREIGAAPGQGGYGWMQWTGPRAHQFLDWSSAAGLDWRGDAANYGFLKHDLSGAYHYAIAAVAKAKTCYDATVSFERGYERAGVPAYQDRFHWADLALTAFRAHDAGAVPIAPYVSPTTPYISPTVPAWPQAPSTSKTKSN